MEIQVDIETKPSHYQLVSGSSTEDSLHVHTQMAENEEEEQMSTHQSYEQTDCVASKTWDITLAQPESIRSDLESSDSQSDDVPDITSDECDSPYPQTVAYLHPPHARGAESPSAHTGQCAQAGGPRPEEMVSTLECIDARV